MSFFKKPINIIITAVCVVIIGVVSIYLPKHLNSQSAISPNQGQQELGGNSLGTNYQDKIKQFQENTDNKDAIGWLYLPNCEIDDIVMQSRDNDYYLRRTENKEQDIWGCYFLDYINVHDNYVLPDKVSIIYGHALDDDPTSQKFSKLKQFKDTAFAQQNRKIIFSLLNRTDEYEIFSACEIPVDIDYIDPNPDDEKYQATLNHMLENSYFNFDVDISINDQILILSTCTSNEDVRFVVAAKKYKLKSD